MTEPEIDRFNKIWGITSNHPISIFYTAVPKIFTWVEYIIVVTGINLLGKATSSKILIAMSWGTLFVFAAYTQFIIMTITRGHYQRLRSANQASPWWRKIIYLLIFLSLIVFISYLSNELITAIKVAIEK